MASATVAFFDDVIAQVVALAAISPIITGMGGNSASQTLALVIQGITLGKLDLKEDKSLVMNEICLALVNGFFTGLVAALVMFFFYQKNLFVLDCRVSDDGQSSFRSYIWVFCSPNTQGFETGPSFGFNHFYYNGHRCLGLFGIFGIGSDLFTLIVMKH